MKVVDRKRIQLRFYHRFTKIDAAERKAYYTISAHLDNPEKLYHRHAPVGEEIISPSEVAIPYDMMHLAPPHTAPAFITASPLAIAEGPAKGWIDVDHFTLQHRRYPNVFALGDAADLPTAKTGAAIRKQAPVLVANLLHFMRFDDQFQKKYNGYSSCPLTTGYGKMLLAEFGYGNQRMSDPFITRLVDTSKEHFSMWLLKKYSLPFMYWNFMMKGRF
jgi:sulfide:quinone oxidoreductase